MAPATDDLPTGDLSSYDSSAEPAKGVDGKVSDEREPQDETSLEPHTTGCVGDESADPIPGVAALTMSEKEPSKEEEQQEEKQEEEKRPTIPAKDLQPEDALNEKRPATPAKDVPSQPALVASPPPPSPPPKDLPPKPTHPIEPPLKDPPKPKSLRLQPSPSGRLYLDPPLTPVPSRPSSPLLSTRSVGKNTNARSAQSSDDENESEIHDLFQQSQHRRAASTSSQHPPRSSSLEEPVRVAKAPEPVPVVSLKQNPPSHHPPPPDDDLPFDFHRFLSQLRHRSADPVAKFLRSFLHEFAKKQWMVHEQVKIVRDFLTFIYGKMDHCEVWREVGDGELDNAQEGMEKLVMNRLYTQTFSPAIMPHEPGVRMDERFPGRKGQHQEDVERDQVLTEKVRIYSWIREEHLDIGDTVTGDGGRRFLELAVKEMLKIGSYRAPRDKVICVLNCCKVIFGLLRHSKSDESADKFVPLLIYVVLRANPEHLVSNVQYILRFRNPDKLNGEAGYYLSSLMGAIQFIENLDRSSLTISPEDFEANVEAAVAAIAERPPPSPPRMSEKPQHPEDPSNGSDEKAAVAGLLRSIQKPLSSIGRIFGDDGGASSSEPVSTPLPGNTPRHSPTIETGDPILTALGGRRHNPPRREKESKLTAEDAAARQASAETEEARRIGRMEYDNVVEILKGMFPGLDRDVIGDVVRMKEGRVGLAVDACLILSAI